jgi:hypothetical protein
MRGNWLGRKDGLRMLRWLVRQHRARPQGIEGDPFPDQRDPAKHRARCAALRKRRAKNKVAKQSRKRNRRHS